MKQNKSFNKIARSILAVSALLVSLMLFGLVTFLSGRPEISSDWVFTYSMIGLGSLIGSFILFAGDFSKWFSENSIFSKSVFLYEKRSIGSWEIPVFVPMIVFGILGIVAFVAVTATERSLIPLHPYAQTLSFQGLSFVDGLRNIAVGAVVPAWLEDMGIFFSIQATAFLFRTPFYYLSKSREVFDNLFLKVMTYAVSITIWSGLFAWFHGRWGADSAAYISAFIFQWINQTLNITLGFFGSWIVHLGNNAGAIGASAFSLTLALVFFLKNRPVEVSHEL